MEQLLLRRGKHIRLTFQTVTPAPKRLASQIILRIGAAPPQKTIVIFCTARVCRSN